MTICISIVTMNRADTLLQVLRAIGSTCHAEHPLVFVTNNASTDHTAQILTDARDDGLVTEYTNLPANLGTDIGRNASHWWQCIGHDTVRMDDKVLPLCPGWLTAMKTQSDMRHSVVATPYDETVMGLYRFAPPVEFVDWPQDQGRGGPLIFLPAGVTQAVGACDELHLDHKYGWTDCLYIERAMLLGWRFGFTLRVPVEYLARANPERRNSAMQWHPLYMERKRQYQEAERDVFVAIEETKGYNLERGEG